MSTFLREKLHSRNAAIAEARAILTRPGASAYEHSKADALLGRADRCSVAMEGHKQGEREGRAQMLRMLSNTPASELSYRGWRLHFKDGSREAKLASGPYVDAFNAYLTGDSRGRTAGEQLGLYAGDDSKGGYAAPMQTALIVLQTLDETSQVRQLARIMPPLSVGSSLGIPELASGPGDAAWTTEIPASDITEDDTLLMGQRLLTPHLLVKFLKCSWQFIQNAVIDVNAWIAERLGYRLARPAERAYVNGDGVGKPLGVFTTSDQGIGTDRDYECSSTTAFTLDNLFAGFYTLAEPYHRNAVWLAGREFYRRTMTLKDGDGNYLYRPTEILDQPDLLLRRPALVSEHAPSTYTAGLPIAVVGDFGQGYTIVDSLGVEIVQRLNELLLLRNQVGYIGRAMTDGAPTDSQAFVRFKLKAG